MIKDLDGRQMRNNVDAPQRAAGGLLNIKNGAVKIKYIFYKQLLVSIVVVLQVFL